MTSAIVVSFNTLEKTIHCLRELQKDLASADAEILVVDNGSSDGSADAIAGEFSAVKLFRMKQNLGFAGANNLAFKQATGDRILLLNSDAYVRPGLIAALNHYLDIHPRTAAVGPRLLNIDGSLQPSCFKFPGPLRSVFDFLLFTAAMPDHPTIGDYRRWPHDRDRQVEFVTGACLMIRKSALQEIGLLDESFFFYFEEADWCYRAAHAGWEIGFTPAGSVIHEGGGSGREQPLKVFNEFQLGHERFIRKHYGSFAVFIHRLVLGIGAMLRLTIFNARRIGIGKADPALIRQWQRILLWCIGRRGQGLAVSNTTPQI